MDSAASDNEYLSVDSLENDDGCKTRQKKKKPRKVSHKRPKTYLELHQSRLVAEFLKFQKCKNELQVNESEKNHAENQHEVRKKPRRRHFNQPEDLQQKNSKIEMLKRGTEYGRKMSSLNRINSQCKVLHKHPRQNSRSCQSLSNDNNNDENASALKISTIKKKEINSSCETFKRKNEELQAKLEQMQIRHCHDKRKAEKIRISLMSNGIDEIKVKEV